MISIVLPASTCAVLITAPTPVVTPQATNAALSRGTSRGNDDGIVCRHNRLLGERADILKLKDAIPVSSEAIRSVCRLDWIGAILRYAKVRLSTQTVEALAALGAERDYHVIAGLYPGHAGTLSW